MRSELPIGLARLARTLVPVTGPMDSSNSNTQGTEPSAANYALAFAVDGPLANCWVHTVHDPSVPLKVAGNEVVGEVVYRFSIEAGRPTLRLATDPTLRSE
eukprot:gene36309-59388_t